MSLSRRQFLWSATASGLVLPAWVRAQSGPRQTFGHGVASGDPRIDRVILWTRVTPATGAPASRALDVRWRVSTDPALTRIVRQGTARTDANRDYTVKVDVGGLQPGRTYYYAFDADGAQSPIGRTRTLPTGQVTRLRFASISCANYPAGFFNVYRILAEREDLDAIIHVGDYLYEFADGDYGDGAALDRFPNPLHEAISLEDYRQRYATYRSDPDLQEAHRQHPFVAVWDDHELANDAWSGGAQNHNPESGEGDWAVRRAAAWKAYMEWMPIREQAGPGIRLYRSLRYGSLADLVMLDTRGLRDEQVKLDDITALNDVNRRLMGAPQEAWLYDTLRDSQRAGTRWRILGQQILFSRLVPPGRPVQSADAWDGYQAERGRVTGFLQRGRVSNVVILTGDLHSSWALDIPPDPWSGYQAATGAGSLAVELVTPAVSSPGLFPPDKAALMTAGLRAMVPSLKFLEGQQRGYVLLDIDATRVRADWYHAVTVTERSTAERLAASFVCESGSSRLVPA